MEKPIVANELVFVSFYDSYIEDKLREAIKSGWSYENPYCTKVICKIIHQQEMGEEDKKLKERISQLEAEAVIEFLSRLFLENI